MFPSKYRAPQHFQKVTQGSKSKDFLGTKACSLTAVDSYAAIIIDIKNKEEGKRQKQCSTKRRRH
jgi:hypothetical protein